MAPWNYINSNVLFHPFILNLLFAYPIYLINTNVGPTTHPYYTKIDGGARPGRSSKDNAVRVARLLFQVDPEVKRVKRLWKSIYVKQIRQVFFERNQKLQKSRQPGTLNAINAAYRLFLNHMLSCSDDPDYDLHDDDIRAINATIKRTVHWGKAFRTVAQGRETEVRQRDFQHLLTTNKYVQLTKRKQARRLVEEVKNIKPDHRQDVDLFVQARDYLMPRLILSCAQRPGAVANVTVYRVFNYIHSKA